MKTNAYYCNECNTAVRLERREDNHLVVACACETERFVRIESKSPDKWEPRSSG